MSNQDYEPDWDKYKEAQTKKENDHELVRELIDFFLWPSIVFGPCSFIILLLTWNHPGEGRWLVYVGMIAFLVIISLKIWLKRQKE